MAGSVFEWAWDYDEDYPLVATIDHTGPTAPAYRATRGGSWAGAMHFLRTSHRDATPPENAYADVGVRCAKTKL